MDFKRVNLGIMMSDRVLGWEGKLNCQRESGGQDYATVKMAKVRCLCHVVVTVME